MARKVNKQLEEHSKEVKKLKRSVKELREQSEELAKVFKKLRKDQEETRKEIAALLERAGDGRNRGGAGSPVVAASGGGGLETGPDREEASKAGGASMISTWITGGSRPASKDTVTGEPEATGAAQRKADEFEVDLSTVEGSGTGGKITVKDVREAAGEG